MPVAKRIAWGIALWAQASALLAQPLTPLADTVTEPLLPTGISRQDVSITGQLAFLWPSFDISQVVHVVGDFRMKIGPRELRAEQGVVWMTVRREGNLDFRTYEVFLYRNATVSEPAGTVSEGPVFFVTLSSAGEVFVSVDRRAFAPSDSTAIYRDALAVRDRVRAGLPTGGDAVAAVATAPLTVAPAQIVEPPLPPEFSFSADRTTISKLDDDDQQVVTCVGGVNLFRGASGTIDPLELRAEAAVVFLSKGKNESPTMPRLGGEDGGGPLGGTGVEAVYLEGDIRMSLGDRTIRASRIYYDLVHDRATILDAVAFAMLPDRDLPIYFRAAAVKQLSSREYQADDAVLTTSEFHTPHYHVGAERIQLIDRTPRTFLSGPTGISRANYEMTNATFNLNNVPLLYWPRAKGSVNVSDTAFRGIRAGFDGDFGARLETKWDFFNLLSFEAPQGTKADLSLDYFSKRGPALGLDIDYERDDSFGLLRTYGIDDSGDDNLGRFRDNDRDGGTRGRATWRHRQYLPDEWQLTLEASYLSDRGFLEEFFKSEFNEDKEQETLFYLKKQHDNWAFTLHGQWRVNDFLTQTERLPEAGFHLIGEPVGDVGTWFSDNRAGFARYRAAEKEFFLFLREGSDGPSSSSTARADSRQEVTFPFKLGPVNAVPFITLRGSAWDESRDSSSLDARLFGPVAQGGVGRYFASYGLRGNMYLWRVYPDTHSDLFDVDGVRHLIKPEVVAWMSHANRDSGDLVPFDQDVEGIDEFGGATLAVKQRWQTKRGPADARRVVDWVKFDVSVGAFENAPANAVTNGFTSFTRPENSVARNFVNSAFAWRVNDATALLSEMNYDLNDGEVGVFDLGFQVDRSPRMSYGIDYRFINETDSNLLGIGMNYKVDVKHTIAVRESFDLERGRTAEFSVAYIRKYPRWYVALIFELDDIEENSGVALSIWPEGLPRAALGPRRFTGLADSTALNPD